MEMIKTSQELHQKIYNPYHQKLYCIDIGYITILYYMTLKSYTVIPIYICVCVFVSLCIMMYYVILCIYISYSLMKTSSVCAKGLHLPHTAFPSRVLLLGGLVASTSIAHPLTREDVGLNAAPRRGKVEGIGWE
jgi:hypothetical protein